MTTSYTPVTGGSGYNIASNSISEDAVTKQIGRNVLNNSSGTEVGTATTPIYIVGSVAGGVTITGAIAVTQSGAWTTSIVGGVSILGGVVGTLSSVIGAVTPYAQPGSFVWGTSSINTGTTASSVLAAPGANLRNYITTVKVTNAAATGVIVDIKDSGGDVLDSGYAAASGGGWSTTFTVPLKQTTQNKSVDVVPRAQGSIIAAIVGYVAA